MSRSESTYELGHEGNHEVEETDGLDEGKAQNGVREELATEGRVAGKGVQEGSAAEVLLDSICSLAHRMGLSIVAEGVETAEEWAIVKRLGCEYVQGWYVAKAMPVEAFWDWRQLNEPVIPPGL